jgi:hypothetical protein
MGRVIILEGPDGGGKTTLANQLVERGFIYKHEGPPPEKVDLLDYYLQKLYDSMVSPNDVVHDRLYLGETIYGPLTRGKDRIGEEGKKLFNRILSSKQVKQYICLPDFDVAGKNYRVKIKEKDDYLKNCDIWEKVYNLYLKEAMRSNLDGFYDYKTDFASGVINSLNLPLTYLPKGAIGSLKAQYLFIGDKPNHPYIDIPFFSYKNSSGYFNAALELAGIGENDLCLYNANNAIGIQRWNSEVYQLLDRLPNLKHVFCLGNVAIEFMAGLLGSKLPRNFYFHKIQHPSYLRRFKGHDPEVMAKLIKEKLNGSTH